MILLGGVLTTGGALLKGGSIRKIGNYTTLSMAQMLQVSLRTVE